MKRQFFLTAASLAGVLMLGASTYAAPITLVSDNFNNATNDITLAGRSPDTDAGSYKWTVAGKSGFGIQTDVGGGEGKAFTTATSNGSVAGGIQFDPGQYGQYTVQATLHSQDVAYMALGFATPLANGTTQSIFSNGQLWFSLWASNGNVILYSDGTKNNLGNHVIANFDSSVDHTAELIYNVAANTATVQIDGNAVLTNISLGSFTPTINGGAFQFQNPTAGPNNTPSRATVDNFQVTGVPEPGSLGLLGAAGLLMLRRRK